MFVDSSVIVAILNEEPGAVEFEEQLESWNGPILVSPLVRYEASLSLARAWSSREGKRTDPTLIRQARDLVDQLIAECGGDDVAITREIGDAAIEAAMAYGKAVGHPADLNFGDCFSYACAKARQARLLYKGSDFAATDMG